MRYLAFLLLGACLGFGQTSDLETATLEQLLAVEVTSASKKVQPLTKVAAAMHVITQEDIRRSAATSIPELLRWVPGIEVAQIDSNKWAITARGFNGRLSNKMLVLMDGRSLYSIDFSGVFWDSQDTILEDIERIEVIRGPGATMWGANAVNGVINIITKHTRNTTGGLVQARGGNLERGAGQIRYGGAIGGSGHYRAFAKRTNRDTYRTESGVPADSSWGMSFVGFRSDWDFGRSDKLMVQGEGYANERGLNTNILSAVPPFVRPASRGDASGGVILARWSHAHRDLSQTAVQGYFEDHRRDEGLAGPNRKVVDLSVQRQQFVGGRNDLQWGAGYRSSSLDTVGSTGITFTPEVGQHRLSTAFIQNEMQLIEGVLSALVGTEIEHNTYTGFEYQPAARLVWTPTATATGWASISRAVRTPARIDRDVHVSYPTFPGPGGQLISAEVAGSADVVSERVRAHELGWRSEWSKRVSTDISTFYNVYSRLRTSESDPPAFRPGPPPVVVISQRYANLGLGEGYGFELSNRFQMAKAWRLTTGYSYLKLNLHKGESNDSRAEAAEGRSPRHRSFLQSSWDLPGRIQLDMHVARTGKLAAVPAYTRADARIAWAASQNLSFSLAGQNLIGPPHVEFDSTDEGISSRSLVSRTVYGQITWKF